VLLFIGCSKNGYIEVRNQSDALIENVSWGQKVDLGQIEIGQEGGKETEQTGELHIFFRKNGKEYVSKKAYVIDAKTSATYIHQDTCDAVEVN